MFLDLDSFLEVAAVNHFLEARTLSFNLFLCRWSTWDSTRWYRRPDAHWPLRSVQQLGAHEGLHSPAVALSGAASAGQRTRLQSPIKSVARPVWCPFLFYLQLAWNQGKLRWEETLDTIWLDWPFPSCQPLAGGSNICWTREWAEWPPR